MVNENKEVSSSAKQEKTDQKIINDNKSTEKDNNDDED